jgi:hypothetical protein
MIIHPSKMEGFFLFSNRYKFIRYRQMVHHSGFGDNYRNTQYVVYRLALLHKITIMKKNRIRGLGYRLKLHIIIPAVYFLSLAIALIIQLLH